MSKVDLIKAFQRGRTSAGGTEPRPQQASAPQQPEGIGAAPPMVDPVTDASQQLTALQAYFAVISAGGSPTASQLGAAQEALGALQADLRMLQSTGAPPGAKVWVSAPVAGFAAAGAGLLGGLVGWFARGESDKR